MAFRTGSFKRRKKTDFGINIFIVIVNKKPSTVSASLTLCALLYLGKPVSWEIFFENSLNTGIFSWSLDEWDGGEEI